MKKLLCALMALVMVLSFAACGSSSTEEKSYVVLDEDFGSEEYGIGFRNEDIALGMAVQNALEEMIADGTAAEISEKWFDADVMLNGDYLEDTTVSEDDDSLQKVLDKGTFVLGLDDSFPPMGYRDDDNNIVGFDIDLATEVCKRLGVELVVTPIDWDSKEMELNSGAIDCIWNGMSITDERLESMFIPKAYIANTQIIIVEADSGISTKADLAGKTIGLQKGSASLDAFNADTETAASVKEVVEYADNIECYLDLQAGRIDAFVVDAVLGRYILATND